MSDLIERVSALKPASNPGRRASPFSDDEWRAMCAAYESGVRVIEISSAARGRESTRSEAVTFYGLLKHHAERLGLPFSRRRPKA